MGAVAAQIKSSSRALVRQYYSHPLLTIIMNQQSGKVSNPAIQKQSRLNTKHPLSRLESNIKQRTTIANSINNLTVHPTIIRFSIGTTHIATYIPFPFIVENCPLVRGQCQTETATLLHSVSLHEEPGIVLFSSKVLQPSLRFPKIASLRKSV